MLTLRSEKPIENNYKRKIENPNRIIGQTNSALASLEATQKLELEKAKFSKELRDQQGTISPREDHNEPQKKIKK